VASNAAPVFDMAAIVSLFFKEFASWKEILSCFSQDEI
jgi:hypothetical protein